MDFDSLHPWVFDEDFFSDINSKISLFETLEDETEDLFK